jgi:hypothetical protein
MIRDHEDPPRSAAALATLVAIRASLAQKGQLGLGIIWDDSVPKPLDRQEAVHRLQELPKPIALDAQTQNASILLRPRQLSPKERILYRHRLEVSLPRDMSYFRAKARGSDLETTVAIVGHGEAITLSLADYQRWVQDYYLDLDHDIVADEPKGSPGVVASVLFGVPAVQILINRVATFSQEP